MNVEFEITQNIFWFSHHLHIWKSIYAKLRITKSNESPDNPTKTYIIYTIKETHIVNKVCYEFKRIFEGRVLVIYPNVKRSNLEIIKT